MKTTLDLVLSYTENCWHSEFFMGSSSLVGTQMGTGCASFVAAMSLFFDKRDFMVLFLTSNKLNKLKDLRILKILSLKAQCRIYLPDLQLNKANVPDTE